ncbi:MAG TPA: MurR/RpiR family transcriptional regulator [Armatimonadota bacterium]|nr:MurR/RpiR family transcriptional regulator [Armatimonadota bacterium]
MARRSNPGTTSGETYPGRLLGTKIAGAYPRLRPAERRVADYVLAHPHQVTGLPIAALAQRCSVSQHTVNRFCASLGIKGYPELKLALAQHLVIAASSLSEQGDHPSTPEGIVAETFRFNIDSLKATLALEQKAQMRAIADLIARCRMVRWFGIGGSAAVCLDGALRLRQLGIDAAAVTEPFSQVVEACWLGARDAAVGVSHTGESRPVVQALQLARESGASTVGITNFPDSALSRGAEHVLLTASPREWSGASTTVVASRIAQLALVDAIYALVAVERTKRVGEAIDRIDEFVEANLRLGKQARRKRPTRA